jgi:hypothetical protein
LWQEELNKSKPILTTIQAGLMLVQEFSSNGLDQLGYMCFHTTVSLFKQFLHDREAAKGKSALKDESEELMELAIATTEYAAFRLSW